MRVIECGDAERERFDAAVAASPLADVLQSYEWGEVKAPTGWATLRLLVEDDDGRARAACSVLRRRAARGTPPLLYAPRGPVVDPSDAEALRALIDAIRARAGGSFMLKCDPPIERASEAAAGLVRAGFRPVSMGAFGGFQPAAVMVLDLSPGADKVFEGFKSKWRYNIRLAERRGVAVTDGTRDDIGAFHDLYVTTARRDGFTPRARAYFDKLWDVLASRRMLKMWVARFEGEPIASIICTAMGDRVVYNYGASSSEHRNVMPNHLIQWTAIRWAAENGFKTYDFRGVSPLRNGEPLAEHLAGLNRFKEGFGARYVEYAGEHDLPLRPLWYAAWRWGAPLALRLRRRLGKGGGGEREAA